MGKNELRKEEKPKGRGKDPPPLAQGLDPPLIIIVIIMVMIKLTIRITIIIMIIIMKDLHGASILMFEGAL